MNFWSFYSISFILSWHIFLNNIISGEYLSVDWQEWNKYIEQFKLDLAVISWAINIPVANNKSL